MSNTDKKSPTIFEEWVEVECEQCERWWLNQCDGCRDGVNGSKTPCNSFLATRSVIIPQQINDLKRCVFGLKIAIGIVSSVVAILVAVLMEVF